MERRRPVAGPRTVLWLCQAFSKTGLAPAQWIQKTNEQTLLAGSPPRRSRQKLMRRSRKWKIAGPRKEVRSMTSSLPLMLLSSRRSVGKQRELGKLQCERTAQSGLGSGSGTLEWLTPRFCGCTLVRLSAVMLESFKLDPLAENTWQTDGVHLCQIFTVEFTGTLMVAANRAAKFTASTLKEDGAWCRLPSTADGGEAATE